MNSQETFELICKALGFSDKYGLKNVYKDIDKIEYNRVLNEARVKFDIDDIYFVKTTPESASIPVIYFKRLESVDPDKIMDIHRRVWNQGKVPLLFIILPGEVKIYNTTTPPAQNSKELEEKEYLIDSLEQLRDVQEIRKKLKDFSRSEIETGHYWYKHGDNFKYKNRVDQQLLTSLKTARKKLHDQGLDYKYIHALIGRSIFILYLQDRGALDDKFFQKFGHYNKFLDFLNLNDSKNIAYQLFELIYKHFDGDMFPLTEDEKQAITKDHLSLLYNFFSGVDINTGQTRLWPFCFDIIPIEMISCIYEEFFHVEKEETREKKNGTYYTPEFLVEFILNEILPREMEETKYLFIWDDIPGGNTELIKFLKEDLKINWIENATIKKSDNNETINITNGKNAITIKLNKTEKKAILEIYNGETYEYILKEEDGKLNICGKIKILDPACGSGIFLVKSYRRMIERKISLNNGYNITPDELKTIITSSIYGIDINEEAIKIAAFSLYLTMLDFLEPKTIWQEVTFPKLIGTNLFIDNFFNDDPDIKFNKNKFDIIVGNPPWEISEDEIMMEYLKSKGKTIGNNQIAQAFLWKALDGCKKNGEICLLVTAKGLLFNRNSKNKKFRSEFFRVADTSMIINFSIIRRELFNKGIGPPAAIFYKPMSEENKRRKYLLYIVPKHSAESKRLNAVVIDPSDVKRLPLREVMDSNIIWKVAMWGSSRDYELIKRLTKYSSLKKICDKEGWKYGKGFIIGDKHNDVPELYKKPYVDAEKLQRFVMNEDTLKPIGKTSFNSYLKTKPEVFQGPHLLINKSPKVNKQEPKKDIELVATLLKNDAVFTQAVFGIHGKDIDLNKLAKCGLILNTKIAIYYLMLISSNWLVERDIIENNEILDIPIPEDRMTQNIDYKFLKELSENPNADEIVNNMASDWYELEESERILINDAIEITLDSFMNKSKSIAYEPVNDLYLFKWDDVPENNTELIKFLNSNLKINWVENATINKGSNNKTITVTNKENKEEKIILKLDKAKEKVTLKIADGETYDYILKEENGMLNICNNLMLKEYAKTFCDTVNLVLKKQGKSLKASIYLGNLSLNVVSFELTNISNSSESQLQKTSNELKKVLTDLDKYLLEEQSLGIYMRRNVRIYRGNTIHVVKLNERRYWTKSVALNDADETIAENISKGLKNEY